MKPSLLNAINQISTLPKCLKCLVALFNKHDNDIFVHWVAQEAPLIVLDRVDLNPLVLTGQMPIIKPYFPNHPAKPQ